MKYANNYMKYIGSKIDKIGLNSEIYPDGTIISGGKHPEAYLRTGAKALLIKQAFPNAEIGNIYDALDNLEWEMVGGTGEQAENHNDHVMNDVAMSAAFTMQNRPEWFDEGNANGDEWFDSTEGFEKLKGAK